MNKSMRNVVIFCAVALGGGFLGMTLDRLQPPSDPMQGAGVLLWLASPLLAVLLLRSLGGDGWSDFGLRPKFKTGWPWYLAALLIPLVVILVTLGMALIFGAVNMDGLDQVGWGAFFSLAGVAFAGALVKNIFEEFSWRGYLNPRLEALDWHPFANALLTGFVWAGWHVPYYLYYLDRAELARHTSLPPVGLIALAFVLLPFHALAYGELRYVSDTTWTAWLMHNVANAISLALVGGGFAALAGGLGGVLLSPGTEGVLHSLLMGLIGWGLYLRRKTRSRATADAKRAG